MKQAKRSRAKKAIQPTAAARQLWAHVKQQLKADEALATLVPEDASCSAFKLKK